MLAYGQDRISQWGLSTPHKQFGAQGFSSSFSTCRESYMSPLPLRSAAAQNETLGQVLYTLIFTSPFIHEETEAQRSQVKCPGSQLGTWWSQHWNPGPSERKHGSHPLIQLRCLSFLFIVRVSVSILPRAFAVKEGSWTGHMGSRPSGITPCWAWRQL